MIQSIGEVPFAKGGNLPSIVSDYYLNKLSDQFHSYQPNIDGLNQAILNRRNYPVNRKVLVETLRKQYADFLLPESIVATNIELLANENTFSITTGHQLCVFTGPLYFHYKIITAINTALQVQAANPGIKVVPMFWMASEDHDFEEIRKFHLYGKSFEWIENTQQSPIGTLGLDGLKPVIDELKGYFRIPEQSNELVDVFTTAYSESSTLAEATRKIIHQLYGSYGLVVIDADERDFKELFKAVIESDVLDNIFFLPASNASKSLLDAGYKTQVNTREVNFFYINNGFRERIDKVDTGYSLQVSGLKFSRDQLKSMIQLEPEKFSPNVVMRPIYQEFILPNIAYVGGPAEVNYWLQFKAIFDKANIFFPTILLRFSAVIYKQKWLDKMSSIAIKPEDFLKSKNDLIADWLQSHNSEELDLKNTVTEIQEIYKLLLLRVNEIDKTLAGTVESEKVKSLTGIENIRQKMLKALKTKDSQALQLISRFYDYLHPEGLLQERKINILEFVQTISDVDNLVKAFNSNDFSIKLLKN